MAVSVAQITNPNSILTEMHLGHMRARIVDITFDSSYLTTGEPLTAASLGWTYFFGGVVIIHPKNATGTALLPVAVVPNSTGSQVALQIYRYDGASAGKANLEEAANAFDASTFTARVMLLGY